MSSHHLLRKIVEKLYSLQSYQERWETKEGPWLDACGTSEHAVKLNPRKYL